MAVDPKPKMKKREKETEQKMHEGRWRGTHSRSWEAKAPRGQRQDNDSIRFASIRFDPSAEHIKGGFNTANTGVWTREEAPTM
mmetsp:Transcript_12911/g.30178  ORF Transcript_12911/g.30178 Transcript_12911/m.30178 type:complete len:83 (+) Transcript_12911:66-314(+)